MVSKNLLPSSKKQLFLLFKERTLLLRLKRELVKQAHSLLDAFKTLILTTMLHSALFCLTHASYALKLGVLFKVLANSVKFASTFV
jgi:hypothetical protein